MESETPIWATALAVNLGAFTLVSWLVRRVFTHTIPRLAGSFEKEREALSTQYQTLLSEQRADFQDALEAQRKVYSGQLSQQRTDFLLSQQEIRQDNRDALNRLFDALKEEQNNG